MATRSGMSTPYSILEKLSVGGRDDDTDDNQDDDRDNDQDKELITGIDLNSEALKRLCTGRFTTPNFDKEPEYREQRLDIASAALYLGGGEAHGKAHGKAVCRVLTKAKPKRPTEEDGKSAARWLYDHRRHYETSGISFDDFERLAINATLEHHPEHFRVVTYLLKKIRTVCKERSPYGSFIKPGTVLRCDGKDRKLPDKPDLHASFIAWPYFDTGNLKPPTTSKDSLLHVPRGLFRYSYPQENTLDREDHQVFRKFRGVDANQYLRVSQLWVLVLQSTTIISCGPETITKTFGKYVEVIDGNKDFSGQPLVEVTDVFRRVTYFPIDQCEDFHRLERTICRKCLPDDNQEINNYTLHHGNSKEEIGFLQWATILRENQSMFIHVRINRKVAVPDRSTPRCSSKDVDEMPDTYLSARLACCRSLSTNAELIGLSYLEEYVEDTKKHLLRQGYVCIHAPLETLILFMFRDFVGRPLTNFTVLELYQEHLSKLRYDAGRRPSRKLLQEMHLLEEEMEIVETVYKQQFEVIRRLGKIIEPDSYRITEFVRIDAHKIESRILKRVGRMACEFNARFASHRSQTAKAVQDLKSDLEIAGQRHSKAILAFTLVTIVFQILSFVASLFGMNTSDIREMGGTQAKYWQAALPLAALIGGISLLVAYGPPIRERFGRWRRENHDTSQIKKRSWIQVFSRSRRRDEEDNDLVEPK
ncbi:hypothetical protein BU24DRAFT_471283 [Aaosphaeria arxii CBS 175.79]|uniref:Uncharacterized protein n=1 Tax=Aaosphaeria arxii CBS 175.79 TaxID=1450172 RepID=A0A6A5Y9R8_9PLEO|nr:uncharacterized protein BU24DRAFT_471283 [Aaosphaeria arxii CBS 175.79]KAF2022168.1 hypothetical protein BU24DRAFT_471283 [Aaosphaeria arxii CBS 175.79]